MKQINYLYLALTSYLMDILTMVAAGFALPWLSSVLRGNTGRGAMVLSGAFLLFAVGVFIFRKMVAIPQGKEEWLERKWRVALAVVFALIISLAFAWQLGYFESAPLADTTQLGEGGSASYFVFGPAAWLAFAFLYVIVLAFDLKPSIDYHGLGYWLAGLAGLLATATLLLALLALFWEFVPPMNIYLWALIVLVVLIVLFLPPRLVYVARTIGLRAPAGYFAIAFFLLSLGIYTALLVRSIAATQ